MALVQAIRDEFRVAEAFSLLDGLIVEDGHFVASKLVNEAVYMELIQGDERIALTKALLYCMSLPYEQLPKYPDKLVTPTLQGRITMVLPPIPKLSTDSELLAQHSSEEPISEMREAAPELVLYCAGTVFRVALKAFIEGVHSARPVSLGRLLIYKALQSHQKSLVETVLQPWVRADLSFRALPKELTIEQMKGILRVMEQTASDLLGQGPAKQIMDAAMEKAKKSPEAREYDPRQLLEA